MPYKPFHISSFENDSGLDTYAESFLIPEKAFPKLEDAYAWRGRIRRRKGFELLGRLRRDLTTQSIGNISSPGAGDVVVNIFTSLGIGVTEPNAEIEVGSVTNISIIIAAPISQTLTDTLGTGTLTVVGAGSITSATLNYVTGDLTMTFSGAVGASAATFTAAYFPSLPVMGLRTRESSILINNEQMIAFDTKYAYQFSGNQFSELVAGTTWSGLNSDFFWTTNYWQNVTGDLFWVTNFSGTAGDPIRYFDGTAWTNFAPAIDGAGNFLHQSLILTPYKDRLLALNTYEGATLGASLSFAQRIRFSQNGDPTDTIDGWLEDVVGKGGFIDIPTNEAIVSAEFIKDVLIVKCERSSWKVLHTGNEILPFVVQQINTELGAESTFSLVPFDRGVFAVGNYGITTDDSVNVARIDQKIPDIVFDFNNDNEGVKRVYGIRSYQQQLVYWSFPNSAENATFPNKILVFNYVNRTYSIFNDSFTCFGYFQRGSDLTWANLNYPSWSDWIDSWNSGLIQSQFPDTIGGNQQGYVEVLNRSIFNGVSLSITAIATGEPVRLTVPNHNLQTGRFVKITGIVGSGSPNPDTLNDSIYRVIRISDDLIDLQEYNTVTNSFDNVSLGAGGSYLGNGKLTVLNNINILTKRFSPYYGHGSQVRLGYVDLFLERTEDGEITVNLFVDENSSISINDPNSFSNEGVLGDNIVLTRPENLTLIPFQANQEKIWHRIFFYSITQNFQLQFTMDDAQMSDESINSSDFILHALTLYLTDNVRMIQ